MRLKYYLRGLGIGILFATIVLMISYHLIHKQDKMTDADVINRAKELGMVFSDDTEVPNTEEVNTEDATEAGNTEGTESNTQSTESDTTGPVVQEFAGVNVEDSTTWLDVFQQLQNLGAVESADDLYQYFIDNYLDKGYPLNSGYYEIPKNADYDTIINVFIN